MKALRWHNKEDIRVDDIPIPKPKSDEVLVKVSYSGICGSELHEYLLGPIFIPLEPHPLTGTCAPQVMGHEYGGVIEEVGSDVKGLEKGTLVTVNPILSCGECFQCRHGRINLCDKLAYYGLIGDGGHAEYSVVKAANCHPLPKGVPHEYAAFGEPAGVAYHGVKRAEIKPGETVVVIGGGCIGQLAAQYAKAEGAGKVYLTEIARERILLAKKIGAADEVFNPLDDDVLEKVLEYTEGMGADCVIECCGGKKTGMLEDTGAQAVDLIRPDGRAVIVGTFSEPSQLHFNNIVFMEKRVVGSWVWQTHQEYIEAMNHIVEGRVQVLPLISSKLHVDEAVSEGIMALQLERDEYMKILIDFT